MVRTRAGVGNAASRKAVVAKAPRKNLAPVRSPASTSSKRKGKAGGGGNSLKLWPVPKWQKGLQSFLGGGTGGSGESSDAGCSSSISTGEGTSSAAEEFVEESTSNHSPSPSPIQSEDDNSTSQQFSFMDDITQTNSDSDN